MGVVNPGGPRLLELVEVSMSAASSLPVPLSSTAPAARRIALALFALLLGVYVVSGSKLQFGYEGLNIAQSEALLRGATQPRTGGGILPVTQGGVLDVAAYLPFSAARLALERAGRLPGLRQLIYLFAIPFYTTLLLLLFYALALELYGDARIAAALALALGLGTMVWPYAKFGMETQQTLWLLAGLLALARYQRRPVWGAAAGLGLCLAALPLTKITGPLLAAALALAWGAGWVRRGAARRPGALRDLALVAALGVAGVLAFLLTNRWRYGGWVYGGRYGLEHEAGAYPFLSGVWAAAFSPGKSIFLFSPALVLGLWYWGAFWRRFAGLRLIVCLLLALGLWQLHLRPWADETWGPRRLHFLLPVLALPLGIWLERRGALRRGARALGWAAIAAGIAVQLLAVSFDYTALARTIGRTDLFAIENTVWEPQLSPLGFNLHLLGSACRRARTGESTPFVYESHYMPWTAPEFPPDPVSFELSGQDRFDFWVLQQRADWPGGPYWFVAGSFYLWLGFLGLALAGGWWLWRMMRNAE